MNLALGSQFHIHTYIHAMQDHFFLAKVDFSFERNVYAGVCAENICNVVSRMHLKVCILCICILILQRPL